MINRKTKIATTTLMTLALSIPAISAEAAKKKEITEVVGYEVTEAVSPNGKLESAFIKIDDDKSGTITFKEFQKHSMLDDEYAIFSEIDTDQSKEIILAEYTNYSWAKGKTHVESELHGKVPVKGTNIKSRPIYERSYFVPVKPTVVDVKPVEE